MFTHRPFFLRGRHGHAYSPRPRQHRVRAPSCVAAGGCIRPGAGQIGRGGGRCAAGAVGVAGGAAFARGRAAPASSPWPVAWDGGLRCWFWASVPLTSSRTYNTAYPVPLMASTLRHLANEAGIGQPAVLAPSAHLARVNAPPLPPPGKRETYTPVPRKSEVDEILALRAGTPAGASADAATPPAHAAAQADSPGPRLSSG